MRINCLALSHLSGGVNLVANDFSDVIVLTVTSLACLYVVCYLSKLIEKLTWINKLLSTIGRDSFYIMGLHFIGFKVATLLLNLSGAGMQLASLLPNVGGSIVLLVVYVVFGVTIPIIIVNCIRCVKKLILCFS